MALEFICANKIGKGIKIQIPKEAEVYRVKSGFIKFFKVNPSIPENEKIIPKKSRLISFDSYEKHSFNKYYGIPNFYDKEGNVLKE